MGWRPPTANPDEVDARPHDKIDRFWPQSYIVVRLMMHKIIITLAIALSVLPNLPSATATAQSAPIFSKGTWTDVTPSGVDLVNPLSCDNYGSITMMADPARPSDLYTQFHCQGV